MGIYGHTWDKYRIDLKSLEEMETLQEGLFFVSDEAKTLKKKLKEIVDSEFKEFYSTGIGKRLAGAFTGKNSSMIKKAYQNSLNKMVKAVPEGVCYGPIQRTRTYPNGNGYTVETYYVYLIYGILKSNKIVKVTYECNSSFFTLTDMDCNIPRNLIKEIFRINESNAELLLNKSSVSSRSSSALVKSKSFAQEVLKKAESMNIPATLDAFGTTVKF